jgi:saccharopine dehydrogenase-like NADP-dependent oxidoreductase
MQELEERCKEAGIVVMNEIGLDPGLDHLCKYLQRYVQGDLC